MTSEYSPSREVQEAVAHHYREQRRPCGPPLEFQARMGLLQEDLLLIHAGAMDGGTLHRASETMAYLQSEDYLAYCRERIGVRNG